MGRVAVKNPRRIGKKLREIRLMLKLSQDGIVERMGLKGELKRTSVSNFERTRRVPSCWCCYAMLGWQVSALKYLLMTNWSYQKIYRARSHTITPPRPRRDM